MMITWTDILIHAALIPLYLVLGTARHEYSHVFSAQLEGVKVRGVQILPHWGQFIWDGFGYAYIQKFWPEPGFTFRFGVWIWGEGKDPSWLAHLMPYVTCLACVALGFYVYPRALEFEGHQGAIVVSILFWVSPGFDLVYNLVKWLVWKQGDFEKVFPHGRD